VNPMDLVMAALAAGCAGLALYRAGRRAFEGPREDGPRRGGPFPRPPARGKERRLEKALPSALERIASGISAGHSLQQAISAVAEDPRHPLASSFASILTGVRTGSTLEEALRGEARAFRRRSIPLALLTMASATRSGCNLVDNLHLLARVCRDREALRGKIDALTAQSRLQGVILALVPLLFLAALALVSPGCLAGILASPLGRTIGAGAVLLEVAGGVVIHRMVNREVF